MGERVYLPLDLRQYYNSSMCPLGFWSLGVWRFPSLLALLLCMICAVKISLFGWARKPDVLLFVTWGGVLQTRSR